MEQPQQLFKIPAGSIKKAPAVQTPQQQKYESNAKLIAVGIFAILALPMLAKMYLKGPFTSLIIVSYWIIIIGVGLFFLGVYTKKWRNKNKAKAPQQETKTEEKVFL